nr:site-specific DNA-methyltransferase [Cronobacter muytjensii]
MLCGDGTSLENVKRVCGDALVDAWITDPPYNVDYSGKTAAALKIKNDKQSDDKFLEFLCAACAAADLVLKPGGVFYIWHADSEGLNFRAAVKHTGWNLKQCLIWNKNVLVMGRSDYHWKHEPCLYGWKSGAAHLWAGGRKQSTVLDYEKPLRNADHPTMKPVGLIETLLLNNTRGGDVILDTFAGSGTTLIAAEKNGRVARLIELDPVYVDVIVRRWQAFTGLEASHEETGRKFLETS